MIEQNYDNKKDRLRNSQEEWKTWDIKRIWIERIQEEKALSWSMNMTYRNDAKKGYRYPLCKGQIKL